MALGRRCDLGCETWPNDDRYKICPECGEDTTLYRGVRVSCEEPEATYRLFEAFYKEWDERMPASRLEMTPTEIHKWESLYPNGRPSPAPTSTD